MRIVFFSLGLLLGTTGIHISRRKENALFQFEEILYKKKVDSYSPRSLNQKYYVDMLNNNDAKIIIATGPAGTGKTLFPCIKSIDMLQSGKINKIVITRPLVTVEEDLGFLPGNIDEKMSPWTKPIFDIFLECYSKCELDKMLRENTIEIAPLAFMRGRTFKDTVIIADEMQNCSPGQMQMVTTRIGKGSRLFITGDLNQSDRGEFNGLNEVVSKMAAYYKHNPTVTKMVEFIALDSNDVQRSKIVKHMIDMYEYSFPRQDDGGFSASNDIIAC